VKENKSKRVGYKLYQLHLSSTLSESKHIVFMPNSTTIYRLVGEYLNRLKPISLGIHKALKDIK